MTVPVMMWIACLLAVTEADPCIDNQHCSDCDNTTGNCLTECDTGYFDQKCSSVCSGNCKNKTCIVSTNGSGNCTDGCVPGYQGASCNIPCDSPGGNCTACPGGCDGGYCQLNTSCVSGCVDSYYGTDCDGKSGGKVRLSVGLSTSAVGFMVMICLVVCCKHRQRLRKRSVTQTEDVVCNNVTEMDDAPVSELEWYSDMPQTDMAVLSQSLDGNCGGPDEAGGVEDDVYDVADGGKREFDAVDCNIYSKLSHGW
ncbi:platelet endothelial aggregation receptor 1-like [Haliotis cracherodii]|uniref:platelet endothelial aggregation receptor 1-like n=1 Tax=Haliotis cracherodii TaxID=6455 RepID=UPI0039EC06B0